jgi:hypothetical protein
LNAWLLEALEFAVGLGVGVGRVRRLSLDGFGFSDAEAKDLGTGNREGRGIPDDREGWGIAD